MGCNRQPIFGHLGPHHQTRSERTRTLPRPRQVSCLELHIVACGTWAGIDQLHLIVAVDRSQGGASGVSQGLPAKMEQMMSPSCSPCPNWKGHREEALKRAVAVETPAAAVAPGRTAADMKPGAFQGGDGKFRDRGKVARSQPSGSHIGSILRRCTYGNIMGRGLRLGSRLVFVLPEGTDHHRFDRVGMERHWGATDVRP